MKALQFIHNSLFPLALIIILLYANSSVTIPLAIAQENPPISTANTNKAEEILSFNNDRQLKIYQQLITEIRCPKCQNQNIADSNADIAIDLRKKVYEMVLQNKSKSEIKQFLLARFGEFVLYKPQFTGKTLLLWIGPLILLLIVIGFVIRIIFSNAAQLTDEEEPVE